MMLKLVVIAFACLLLCGCPQDNPSLEPAGSEFIRYVEEGPNQAHLDTAIVTYKNPQGIRVDLIAVVHLADPGYYESLEYFFPAYDAVLYELIASEGAIPDSEEKDDSILSLFQRGLCRNLELAFQLDSIDYSRENFVHADLTVKEFKRIWEERGESFLAMFMRLLFAQVKARGEGAGQHMTPEALIAAWQSKDRASGLKMLLARELPQIETVLAALDTGKEGEESILIGERNKAAIRVLEDEMDQGQKRLALFYGAGHMMDLEVRLQRDLGFEKTGHEWFTAWSIQGKDE